MRFRKFLKPYRTRGSSFREHTGRMEGEVYLGAIKQNIIVMFDKKAPIDYVKSQLEYLWSLDDKIIKKMCFYANLYRKDIMEECPDQDYPEGLERIKDPLELLSDDTYMKIYYPNPEKTLWDKLDAYLNS